MQPTSGGFSSGHLAMLKLINGYMKQIEDIPQHNTAEEFQSDQKALGWAVEKILDFQLLASRALDESSQKRLTEIVTLLKELQVTKDQKETPKLVETISKKWKDMEGEFKVAGSAILNPKTVKDVTPPTDIVLHQFQAESATSLAKAARRLSQDQGEQKIAAAGQAVEPEGSGENFRRILVYFPEIRERIINLVNILQNPAKEEERKQKFNEIKAYFNRISISAGTSYIRPFLDECIDAVNKMTVDSSEQVKLSLYKLCVLCFLDKESVENYHGDMTKQDCEDVLKLVGKPSYIIRFDPRPEKKVIVISAIDDKGNISHNYLLGVSPQVMKVKFMDNTKVEYSSFNEYRNKVFLKDNDKYSPAPTTQMTFSKLLELLEQIDKESSSSTGVASDTKNDIKRYLEILRIKLDMRIPSIVNLFEIVRDKINALLENDKVEKKELNADLAKLRLAIALGPRAMSICHVGTTTEGQAELYLKSLGPPAIMLRWDENHNLIFSFIIGGQGTGNFIIQHDIVKDVDPEKGIAVLIKEEIDPKLGKGSFVHNLHYFRTYQEYKNNRFSAWHERLISVRQTPLSRSAGKGIIKPI